MASPFIVFDRNALTILVRFEDRPALRVARENLEVSYFSGGPGGQNVNKNMSGVRLGYRIPVAYRKTSAKSHELMATSIGERQRERNWAAAFETLAEKIRRYFYVKPGRKPTKVPYGAKQRRLGAKKRQGLKKQSRKIGSLDL